MLDICRTMLRRSLLQNRGAGEKYLDVGCGTGLWTTKLSQLGTVCGLDFSPDALTFCQKRGIKQLVRASATSLPFADASYNVITALGLIEHLDDDKGFLRELYRVCKPEGHILLLTSAYNFLWSEHDEIVHHKRRYARKQVEALLNASGFKVVSSSYVNTLLFVPILFIRLIQRLVSSGGHSLYGSPDLFMPRQTMNRLLYRMLWIEAQFLKVTTFPFGVGIVLLAKRPS
jgi:SAM-dependent methyltransferase